MDNIDFDEARELVKKNEELTKKYWEEKKTWSRQEILDFIRTEVNIDDIV